jgi:beta-fructofuranosidase
VAVEGTLELNLLDRLVRPVASCLDILAEPDDRKHPPPGADQVALLIERGAGMNHRAAVSRCRLETSDHLTRCWRTRVTRSGEDDGHCRTTVPVQLGMRSKITGCRGVQHTSEGRCQAGQQRLGLGIAEPCVELDHPNTANSQRQAGVQQSAERCAATRHLIHSWLQHFLGDLFDKIIRRPRQRGVRAHPAGVGSGIAIPDALEVLRGLQGAYGAAIGYREQTHLRPIEKLLDHHPTAAHGMINSGPPVVGDDHALTCRQPIVLYHVRRPEHVQRLINFVARHALQGTSRWHTRCSHGLLGEGLAALQLRRGRGRAETVDPVRAYHIGHARHQRRLGPDDNEIDSQRHCQVRHGLAVKRIEVMIRAECSSPGVARRSMQLDDIWVATQGQSERMFASPRADHQHAQWTHHVPRAYPRVQAGRGSLPERLNEVAFRSMADHSLPILHIRPSRGWLNDPNGLCRIDGRYHVFFQYNPVAPVHEAIHWGHVSSTDLIHWQEHPVALAPRPGFIDAAGCWSGCVVDDGGVPTAVYTANRDGPRNAVVALARSDRSLMHWQQLESPVKGISTASGMDEVRDPFVFVHEGRRYAVQGAGQPAGCPELVLYGCDDLTRWTELGALLTTDDPIAAEVAPANIWECPNLVRIDGQWVLLVSLWRPADATHELAGVRYLLGDLVAQGRGWRFNATSGGLIDDGPAFYAPQVLAEPDRTLLWGWAWELGRSAQQVAEAGWAGVLTFPRELYLRDGVLGVRPATELTTLRSERLVLQQGQPFQAQAFELVASGPVVLRLTKGASDVLVLSAEGTATEPARILVDGSIVEIFQRGTSHTTRVYPTADSNWVVDGTTVTAYRLGGRVAGPATAGAPPSPG